MIRMFGGADGQFNPDMLSGRLEEMLPTIQSVSSYYDYDTMIDTDHDYNVSGQSTVS